MANIRGISLICAVKYINNNYGESGFTKILDTLESEDKEILKSKLHPMNWYPAKTFVNFINAADKILGRGDYELCVNIGRANAEDTFSGLYKVFLELGNPHFVIRRAHIAWRTIFDMGELELEQTGEKYAKGRITGFEGPNKGFCWELGGYLQRVLEMSGARNVKINEIRCACQGDEYCEYVVQWE